MVDIVGPPRAAIRNQPISFELERVLRAAAHDSGVDKIHITSGGQPAIGEPGRRTGSTRHDRGRAADLRLLQAGRVLSFTDTDADPVVKAFVTAAASYGANGIGAGVHYMGPTVLHIGFGTNPDDHREITWGAGNASLSAPKWLRDAAKVGWRKRKALPAISVSSEPPRLMGEPYTVLSREGVWLRKGPGLHFERARLLPAGQEVFVISFDGSNAEWAKIDLEGDGLIDGHVFIAFIAPLQLFAALEQVSEPDDTEAA